MSAIASAVLGIGDALTGRNSLNSLMGTIQRDIDRDVEAQKVEIAKKGSAVDMLTNDLSFLR